MNAKFGATWRLRFWLWLYQWALAHVPETYRAPLPMPPVAHGNRVLRLPRGQARRLE